MIRYEFRDDAILKIKDLKTAQQNVQKIGELLHRLAAENGGRLVPKNVVDAARGRGTLTHRHFEWNNEVAGEAYRLEQARSLIRSIEKQIVDEDSEEPNDDKRKAFFSIHDRDGTAYRTEEEVMSSADLQSKVLAAAERDLLAFERRFSELTELCAAIRKLRNDIRRRRNRPEDDDGLRPQA